MAVALVACIASTPSVELAEGPPPSARLARTVIVVAHNRSVDDDLPPLRYADDDGLLWSAVLQPYARRVLLATALDDDTQATRPLLDAVDLFSPTRDGLDEAVARARAGVEADRAAALRTELWFVFVGHGSLDDHGHGALHLEDARMTRAALFDVVDAVGADVTHVVLDACHAYSVVAGRGDQPASAQMLEALSTFLSGNDLERRPRVGVLVATTANGETHEWSRIRQGLFSHQLRSALSGAADVNGDGRLEYSEVAAFVDAANARLPRSLARLSVFAWPPAFDRGRPLLDLHGRDIFGGGAPQPLLGRRWVVVGPAVSGKLIVEDRDGTAWTTLNKGAEILPLSVPSERELHVRGGRRGMRIPAGGRALRIDALPEAGDGFMRRGAVARAFEEALFAVPFGEAYYRGFLSGRAPLVPVDDGAPRVSIAAEPPAGPRRFRGDAAYQVAPFLLADLLRAPPLEHGASARVLWTEWPVDLGVLVEGGVTALGAADATSATRLSALALAEGRVPLGAFGLWLNGGLGPGLLVVNAGERSSIDDTVLVGRAGFGVDLEIDRVRAGVGTGVLAALLTLDGSEEVRAAPFGHLGVGLVW